MLWPSASTPSTAGPRGGAAVLGVLAEGHNMLHTISFNLFKSFVSQRLGVPEPHIGFVWGRLGAQLVQPLAHQVALLGGPVIDRRASTNLIIFLNDTGCSTFGYPRTKFVLERTKPNNVPPTSCTSGR